MNMKLFLVMLVMCIHLSLSAYPVAIFHGIGDQCSNGGMQGITQFFSEKLDTYAKCIETAGGSSSLFTSFKNQAKRACEEIKNDPNFQSDFSVLGISQGALLARYIIESCDMKGTVLRYVSIGGPQMGVAKIPHCDSGVLCSIVNKAVGLTIYTSLIQNNIGPAGYYKDINYYSLYKESSTFLAELNNEKDVKDPKKKQRFTQLEKVVLIKFSEDTMILPKETAWFQFYNNDKQVPDLKDTEFYNEDFIGVKYLNISGNIQFVEIAGDHLNFDLTDLEEYAIPALS